MRPILIKAGAFSGWALETHTVVVKMPSGSPVTRRSSFGDLLYRYGYNGECELLPEIVGRYAEAIRELLPGALPDLLVAVPPPVTAARYERTVTLATGLGKAVGMASGQFAVRSQEDGHDPTGGMRSRRAFSFPSPTAAGFFAGKRVLVIDDLFRTGTSIREFCTLLVEAGKTAEVRLLVGTKKG